MLTYRRVLLFLFLAAFAKEEAGALGWLLTLVTEVGSEAALQGLGYSTLALAANAGLIFAALWLIRRWWRSRHRSLVSIGPTLGDPDGTAKADPTVPLDPVGQGGPGTTSRSEKGGSDEQHSERT